MSSSFLIWGLAHWLAVVVLFFFLYSLGKKGWSFSFRVFLALIVGLLLGYLSRLVFLDYGYIDEALYKQLVDGSFQLIGRVYFKLIRMLILPIVTISIIRTITHLRDSSVFARLGIRTISLFALTGLIASLVGLGVALLIQPGQGISLTLPEGYTPRDIPSLGAILLDRIPGNLINEMLNDRVVPLVIFSFLFGLGVLRNQNKTLVLKEWFESVNIVVMDIVRFVLSLTPYGVLALMYSVGSSYGINLLLPLLSFIAVIYLASFIQLFVVYTPFIMASHVNPLRFYQAIFPAMLIAFSTSSSAGTIPATLGVLKKRLGISETVADFVGPLGASVHMNGCGAIFPTALAIFVANVYQIDLTWMHYFILILSSTLVSLGAAGIPGVAVAIATAVLSAAGLPLEGIALVLGIDRINDMIRTTVNVTGDMVVALYVAYREKEFDPRDFATRDLRKSEYRIQN